MNHLALAGMKDRLSYHGRTYWHDDGELYLQRMAKEIAAYIRDF